MSALEPIDLREAAMSVAVANTPIFLARRLQENPAVRHAYQLHGPDKIFAALQTLANRKPNDLNQASEVYFYLVALSLDNEFSWLRRARSLRIPHVKWFAEIADYLLKTTIATVTTSVRAPVHAIINPTSPANSTANTVRRF